jgi:hypothetical protein
MGLFSSKYERVSGFQYVDMGHSSIDSYFAFRRQLLFASGGDAEFYQMEMWKYKNKYRRKYDTNKMTRNGFGAIPQDLLMSKYTEFKSIEGSLLDGIVAINESPFPSLLSELGLTPTPNVDTYEHGAIRAVAMLDRFNTNYSFYNYSSFSSDSNPYYDGLHSYTRYHIGNHSLTRTGSFATSSTMSNITVYTCSYTSETYWTANALEFSTRDAAIAYANSQSGSHNVTERTRNIYAPETSSPLGYDVTTNNFIKKVYPYVKCRYLDINTSKELPVNSGMLLRGSIADTDKLVTVIEAAPMITLKKDNIVSVAEQLTDAEIELLSQEEKDKLEYEDKKREVLSNFGLSMDSVTPYLDNQDIDDFKIGLTVAPDDAVKKLEVARVLYETLDAMSSPESLINGVGGYAGAGSTLSIDISGDGFSAVTSFNISKSIKSGSISSLYGYPAKFKVVLKQNIPNSTKYRPEMILAYLEFKSSTDTSITNGLSTQELYLEVMDKIELDEENGLHGNGDHPLRVFMPSPSAKNSRYPSKYIYVYCQESEIEATVLKDRTYNESVIYDIKNYNQLAMSSTLLQFRATSSDLLVLEPDGNGDMSPATEELIVGYDGDDVYATFPRKVIGMKVMKQINATQYVEYIIYNGKMVYQVGQDTVVKHYDKNDSTFRIPVKYDVLKGKPYYQFVELYDSLVSGSIFTVQVVKIKWYQQEWFQIVLMIIIVIITVVVSFYTAGTGASIGAVLGELLYTAAVAVAIGVAVDTVLDALGVDNPYIRAAVGIVVAYYTGDFSAVDGVLAVIGMADAYMQQETIEAIEEREHIAEQSEAYFKRLKAKYKDLNEAGSTGSRTRESIIANIVKNSSGINISSNLIAGHNDPTWMPPFLKNMGLKPSTILPEKGIIKKPMINLPPMDITMGVATNTFVK